MVDKHASRPTAYNAEWLSQEDASLEEKTSTLAGGERLSRIPVVGIC